MKKKIEEYLEEIRKKDVGDEKIIFTEILSYITGKTYEETRKNLLFSDFTLSFSEEEKLKKTISEFLKDEIPYEYLTERKNFFGIDFVVSKDTLIPRNDTETVVENALEKLNDGDRVLDLCTGTGCIGLTLATKKNVSVILADFSEKALEIAEKNIKKTGTENKAKTLLFDVKKDSLFEKFDMIISNPPYVSDFEMDSLSSYVKKEPYSALFGGKDGLLFYEIISEKFYENLKNGGVLIFEIGEKQKADVTKILEKNNYKNIGSAKDNSGKDRTLWGYKII